MWRARFEREGLLEKAGVFEVALPAVEGGGGGGSSSTATAGSERDELAGVGLAFYAQVFALEVSPKVILRSLRGQARASLALTYPSHHRACPPPRRGTR